MAFPRVAAAASPTTPDNRLGRGPTTASNASAGHAELRLLGGFELLVGRHAVELPLPAQRLLAFLALEGRPVGRARVAGVLWLDTTDTRAAGSLRSALWRVRRSGHDLVEERGQRLRLSALVGVDVQRAAVWASRVAAGPMPTDGDLREALASRELLPDWYDDWVLLERERLRQVRVHALEALSERLTAAARFAPAMEVALAAVKQDPLRESAHRAVINVHLAEGNRAEAVRHRNLYLRLLREGSDLDPSPRLDDLLGELAGATRP